jgi:uroporphyrinogen-III synthase
MTSMTSLSGLNVWVTRPGPAGAALCEQISREGGTAFHLPTLAFAGPSDETALKRALLRLGEHEWWVFTSPQAVYASAAAIRRSWPPAIPATIKWAAVGPGTAKALNQEWGVQKTVQYPSADWSSEGLLAMPAFQDMAGKKVAIVRGAGGMGALDAALAARGAFVLPVIVYERTLPVIEDIGKYLDLLIAGMVQIVISTSYEGTQNLKRLLTERGWPYLKKIPLIVPSQRVKMLAQALGFEDAWAAPNASHASILLTAKRIKKHANANRST